MPDLNLDAFREKPKVVVIDGKEFQVAPFNLGNFEKFAGLREGFAKAGDDLAKLVAASIAVYRFVLPTAPDETIRGLTPAQQEALADFWLSGASEEVEEQERDARSVVADPTPPG